MPKPEQCTLSRLDKLNYIVTHKKRCTNAKRGDGYVNRTYFRHESNAKIELEHCLKDLKW